MSYEQLGQLMELRGLLFKSALKVLISSNLKGIDYTHCLLLGVTKLLITLCVSSTFSKKEISIAEYFLVLNLRLI